MSSHFCEEKRQEEERGRERARERERERERERGREGITYTFIVSTPQGAYSSAGSPP